MEMSDLGTVDTYEHHVTHPTMGPLFNDDQPVTITFYCSDSKYMRDKRNERINELRNKRQKTEPTLEDRHRQGSEDLAVAVRSVKGMEYEGKKVTPANIIDLFENPSLAWFREQCSQAFGDRANFLKNA